MRNLFNIAEDTVGVVTEDSSPAGPKEYLIWSPTGSSLSDATRLMKHLMKRGLKVILFCKVSSRILPYIVC